jgi:hypothetical protein
MLPAGTSRHFATAQNLVVTGLWQTLAAPPIAFSAKEQQQGIRQSENEDYVE